MNRAAIFLFNSICVSMTVGLFMNYGKNADAKPIWEKAGDAAGVKVSPPKINVSRPNVNIPHPNVNIPHPNVNIPHPNVNIPHPNVNIPHPNVNIPHPNVNIPHPNVNIPHPNVNIPHPNVNIPHPNVNIPHPNVNIPPISVSDVGIPRPNLNIPRPNVKLPNLIADVDMGTTTNTSGGDSGTGGEGGSGGGGGGGGDPFSAGGGRLSNWWKEKVEGKKRNDGDSVDGRLEAKNSPKPGKQTYIWPSRDVVLAQEKSGRTDPSLSSAVAKSAVPGGPVSSRGPRCSDYVMDVLLKNGAWGGGHASDEGDVYGRKVDVPQKGDVMRMDGNYTFDSAGSRYTAPPEGHVAIVTDVKRGPNSTTYTIVGQNYDPNHAPKGPESTTFTIPNTDPQINFFRPAYPAGAQ